MPGDIVLLASDGLSKMVTDAEMTAVIKEMAEPRPIVDALIARARAAGGVDNVTVVVARVRVRQDKGLRGVVSRFFGF